MSPPAWSAPRTPPPAAIGLPILEIDRKAQRVIGPFGDWRGCPIIILNVLEKLIDGSTQEISVLQKLAGFNRPDTFDTVMKRWKDELHEIGVEMITGPDGIRLQRQEIV